MKKFMLLFTLITAFAVSTFAQHYISPLHPRYGIFPNEGNKYANLTIGFVNAPDTSFQHQDSVKLLPFAYKTQVTSMEINQSVIPFTYKVDSVKDTIVYVLKSLKGALFGDEINFHLQAANDTATITKNKHRVKFSNKYTSGWVFSTAADSTIVLTSKGYLDMTFKFDGFHFVEVGKNNK